MADYRSWVSAEDVPEVTGTHPFAELFPRMSVEDFNALLCDIDVNGQRDAVVVMPDGRVLDGRHRLEAVYQGEPVVVRFIGSDDTASEADALSYVLSVNGVRRHLSQSQRAMIAARVRNFTNQTQQDRALAHGVSKRLVEHADRVLECGDDELITRVDNGMTVTAATKLMDQAAAAEELMQRQAARGDLSVVPSSAPVAKRPRITAIVPVDPPPDFFGGVATCSGEVLSLGDLCDSEPIPVLEVVDGRLLQTTPAEATYEQFKELTRRLSDEEYELSRSWFFDYAKNNRQD